MITSYVVGLAFRGCCVALTRKRRPAWQVGKLNGVGGHVKLGEAPGCAMRREFREEAGIDIAEEDWRLIAFIECEDLSTGRPCKLYFFTTDIPGYEALRSMTDEAVAWWRVNDVVRDPDLVENLRWLIPLARCTWRYFTYATELVGDWHAILKAPVELDEWVEENICKPYGLTYL